MRDSKWLILRINIMTEKRILICCNRIMNHGGIEKALITLLRAFNTKDNKVLLVLHNKDGELYPELPLNNIEVFYVSDIEASEYLRQDIKHFRLVAVAKGLWNRLRLRFEKNWYARIMYTYRIIERGLKFPGHFDCAISFSTDYSDLAMVASADADKRVAFVHGDATQGKRIAKLNDHLVNKMDRIYAVSDRAKDLFVKMHPECKNTMDVLYNVILREDVEAKSNEHAEDMICDGTLALCTVGRVSPEKGQQMIPKVAELLREYGKKFRWYIVGDGGLKEELEQKVVQLRLDDCIFLLGSKTNPYPYIKKCDIYVQPSFSEAFCTTTVEAKILQKPIVTTDAPGMREQFTSGENGLIVDAMTPEALFEGIKTLLDNPEICRKFTENLKKESFDNNAELQKLYDFIEN